jgi:hypothetical protein
MTTRDERVGRALDVLVYAPLGLGLWLRDLAPSVIDTLVSRGRAEVDRRQVQAQQHVTTARSTGEVALAFGVPKLRARAERQVRAQVDAVRQQADRLVENISAARSNGKTTTGTAPAATPPPRHAPAPDAAPVDGATAASAEPAEPRSASSAHLPIPGYDALSASQVVERLAGLGADDLHAVRDYETSNRNRRTILGKIDQLASS